jgi:hypothetical protein
MEAPLAVTALMKADLIGEAGVEMIDVEDVCQEFDEFEDLVMEAGMLMGVFLDVQDAGPGWRNDVVEFAEVFDEEIGTSAGEVFEPGVGHGLAAAGLIGRIDNFAAAFFQQLKSRYAYLWIKLVDITGNKKANAHDPYL